MNWNQGGDNKKASKLRPIKTKSKSIKTDDNGKGFQSLGGGPRVPPPPQYIPSQSKKTRSLIDQDAFPKLGGNQPKQLETSNQGESEKKEKVREKQETSSPKKQETRPPIKQLTRQTSQGIMQTEIPRADSSNGQGMQNDPMEEQFHYPGKEGQIQYGIAGSAKIGRAVSTNHSNHVATQSGHYSMIESVYPKPQLGRFMPGTERSSHTITRNHLQTIIQAPDRDVVQRVEKPIKVAQTKLPTNLPKALQQGSAEDRQRSWNRTSNQVRTQSKYQPKKDVIKEDNSKLGRQFKMNTAEILNKNLDKIKKQTKLWNKDNWQELIKQMEAEMKQLQQCWNIIKNRSSRQCKDDQKDQEQKIQKICQNFGDQSLQLISSNILDILAKVKEKDPDVVQKTYKFNYCFQFRKILNIVDELRWKKQWRIEKQRLRKNPNYRPKFVWRYFQTPDYVDRQRGQTDTYGNKMLQRCRRKIQGLIKELGIKKPVTVYHVHGKRKNYDGEPKWKAFLETYFKYKQYKEDETGKQEGYFEVEY